MWAAIRVRHWELPPAVLVTGAGKLGPGAGARVGYFATSRWQTSANEALGEVLVGW